MSPIDTDNIVSEFIVNTNIILRNNMEDLHIKKVYDEDVSVVDVVPSIATSVMNIVLERRSLGSVQARFEADIIGELWYYHEGISVDTRKNEVMCTAWSICKVLQENATLNGWLASTRAYVRTCTWALRRNSNLLLASARIILVARKQLRITTV